MDFKDYYQALGVSEGATSEEIKRAYKKLARKHHPDVNKEAGAEAKFREIGEAYEVLGDEAKRKAYDQARARKARGEDFEPAAAEGDFSGGFSGGFPGGFSGGFSVDDEGGDYSEFFEQLFGRNASRARQRRRPPTDVRGQDQHVALEIDLEDTLRGAKKQLTLRTPALDDEGHVVLRERTLDVDIPKGIRAGQHLRLSGQGGPGRGSGGPGDLYLEVSIRPHPLYRVEGRDLHVELPLAPWEATLGGKIVVPVPGGGTIELTVPAASTAGRKIRIKGKGIPGDPAGDLYATLTVVAPPATDDAQRAAYQAFQAAFPGWSPRSTPGGGASS
jgi:curved DNA-binding protein